jgi:Phosphotransferase enzyme family
VLRDAWHVLLHLQPAPIVARVSTGLPYPEGPDPQDLVRELAVASHAASRRAAVVPPSDLLDPGPHERNGHIITFWRYIEPYGDLDPAAAGRALRGIHDALVDCSVEVGPMSRSADMHSMLDLLSGDAAAELLGEIVAQAPAVDGQVLHGDAHLWNCLGSPDGPLWHDFETTVRAPREYDLAALVMRDRINGDMPESRIALAAYGDHDAALVDELIPLYAAWVTASMLVALPRRPELGALVETRLAWLRGRRGSGGGGI